ncbi:MAG: hypothetical protein U5K79_00145 [Cyclobacteriaceae bacterium]|nr:hypothetical protein [Cyclobacteriaceae bacterium]
MRIFFLCFPALISYSLLGRDVPEDSVKMDSVKKGWTFGALPVVSYDTDVGFQYGALVNFFNYGDGSTYPEYLQSIYMEWSRTTKGSGVNRIYFDSKHTIPGIWLTADVSYLTEQSMQFFGFNGYDAVYLTQPGKMILHQTMSAVSFIGMTAGCFGYSPVFPGTIAQIDRQIQVAGRIYLY